MITVNLYYTGTNGSARAFAAEMESSGIADEIRNEPGNLRYQYFTPLDDPETVLKEYGFTSQDNVWILEKKGYSLKVTPKIEETDSGTLRTYEVAGIEGEKTLITLPSTRYIPKEVSP